MTTDQMREQILKSYPGERWRNRVANMADRQVIAIYKNLQKRGELKPHKRKHIEQGEQLTIWMFM